jgi:uncharacterized protein (DUF983 family)
MLEEHPVSCPYCGEGFTAFIDASQANHNYVEDCHVCCRPIEFHVEADGINVLSVSLNTDTE